MRVFLAVLMVALLIAAVIVAALWSAEDIKKTLRTRGEVAEASLPDPDLFDQDAPWILAGPDLDYARTAPPLPDVPVGTGEGLARELTDYLRSVR